MMKQLSDPRAISVWKSLSEKKTVLLIRHSGLIVRRDAMVKPGPPAGMRYGHHFIWLL